MVAILRYDYFILSSWEPEISFLTKQVLLAYYKLAHPWFGTCVGISSFLVAWNFLDPIEDPESGHDAPVGIHEDMVAVHDALAAMLEVLAAVYEVLVVWWIVSFFVEYLYIVRLNYMSVYRFILLQAVSLTL
jgi:hypothetical protein